MEEGDRAVAFCFFVSMCFTRVAANIPVGHRQSLAVIRQSGERLAPRLPESPFSLWVWNADFA